MIKRKLIASVSTAILLSVSLIACSTPESNSTEANSSSVVSNVSSERLVSTSDTKLDIDLDDEDKVTTWDEASATEIKLNGENVTISKTGTYVLSGKLENGQIMVNVSEKGTVRIILDGVDISNSDTAPIVVAEAKKVIFTLADGTTNTITDSGRTTTESEDYSAAIYSKADMVINGAGTLNVNAGYRNGIKSADDLKIVDGTINVDSKEDGIIGKDLLGIAGGTFNVNAGQDGMKSTYDTDTTKGNVVINGGTFVIASRNDGIQSENILLINGGIFDIKTGGGYSASTKSSGSNDMGNFRMAQTQTTASGTTSDSMKALKSGNATYIYDGTFKVDSQDDSIHTNGSVVVNGGTFELASGDDGIHADKELTINAGNINITNSYEGIEGCNITINGGDIKVVASDDGMNAASADASTQMAAGGRPGQATTASGTSDITLVINGGNVYVNATGDGLDSNGSMKITGGYIVVDGPTSNNDAALDTDGNMEFTGGTIMAFGSSGMLETPTSVSNMYCIVDVFTSVSAGSEFSVKDSSGNVVMSYTPSKAYSSAIIASADLKDKTEYTVTAGSSAQTITTSGTITSSGYSGGAGGMMNPGGGKGGNQGAGQNGGQSVNRGNKNYGV